ncbi:MAG: flagellar basal body-associated FliL family protein [Rhodobacteraceae bacterium]|nr:flagellar basal body-associated FliL family protein [Paracoccaceae bacterium]
MAKPAQTKKKADEEHLAADPAAEGKAKSSKKMLVAAALMSIVSLGGGFFLARMAYIEDASSYEPDYVDEKSEDSGSEYESVKSSDRGVTDPLAKEGHPAEQAMALKKDKEKSKDDSAKKGEDGELVDNGLLDFGDIMTNIQGFDARGAPTKAFLKVSLIMVYRTDPGAAALVREREPFMRDLFNGYLRGLTEADVRGMAGILHVKAELLKRARAAVGNDLPQEILINDLIVQ